jgi:hypothetical protein
MAEVLIVEFSAVGAADLYQKVTFGSCSMWRSNRTTW